MPGGVFVVVKALLGWAQVDSAKWAGSGDVQEPGVDAEGVEFVVAGEDAEGFASVEVFGAD